MIIITAFAIKNVMVTFKVIYQELFIESHLFQSH